MTGTVLFSGLTRVGVDNLPHGGFPKLGVPLKGLYKVL